MSGAEHQRDVDDTEEEGADRPAPTWQLAMDTGDAVATHGGIAVTGVYTDNSTTVLPPEVLQAAADTDAPSGIGNLPFPAGNFVGRAQDLALLDAALATPGTALVQAVSGLGGVGKSALAVHWAHTRPHGHSPVRWITADSTASVQRGLASLGVSLRPAQAKALTTGALVEFALQWLATHTGWLLILDNVNDPADVAPLIARARHGRFLLTSRLSLPWTDKATLVSLDTLNPEESLDLLTLVAGARGSRDMEGGAELCDELGHLPLALEQAGAYIAEADITPRAYLRLLAAHPADIFRDGEEGRPPERTMSRIWRVTLDRLTGTPEAGHLLRTLAWFAPDAVPRGVLAALGGPPAVQRAIARLAAYSMIKTTSRTVTVHRLVQSVARTPDASDPHRQAQDIEHARRDAVRCLGVTLPDTQNTLDDPDVWPAWRALVPHIDALADQALPDTDDETTAALLREAGLFLASQGLVARGLIHLSRAERAQRLILGEAAPQTLTSRAHLAHWLTESGDPEQAIALLEDTLNAVERAQGSDHTDTLGTRNNLADAYESHGDLDHAIALYERTLADCRRLFGPEHPDTLTVANNLAFAYEKNGDLDKAVPLYESTLAARRRESGDTHIRTLILRINLGRARATAGDTEPALALLREAALDCERLLGETHPLTKIARDALVRLDDDTADRLGTIPADG
ncbi:FxSxx-COOH system tetratricopeptide repeat protein [Streptomyces sp. P9-2B-2]|uniref:FxSxx-COOH system tetratricopeptide repeat protein n=1 Tax=Streptomyces sp. P9-2B-2 TaxID=3057114 RepID=UPI0025B3E27C|nr:FxSxx-COOH system tetratricopeptide repeat protein [Streptomyces sp. P9-2B-2]WJY41550.1 FxSxx-COOH system tetratricopeptide repeat protein [Streptomyces sp. P9-2B-2]